MGLVPFFLVLIAGIAVAAYFVGKESCITHYQYGELEIFQHVSPHIKKLNGISLHQVYGM